MTLVPAARAKNTKNVVSQKLAIKRSMPKFSLVEKGRKISLLKRKESAHLFLTESRYPLEYSHRAQTNPSNQLSKLS